MLQDEESVELCRSNEMESGSHLLLKTDQRGRDVILLEALAVAETVEHFSYYLYGNYFDVSIGSLKSSIRLNGLLKDCHEAAALDVGDQIHARK